MLEPKSLQFLKQLLDTPGPSGFESAPARVWRAEAATFAEVRGDVHGNSIATVHAKGAPTIMLAGHIDEIGVIVQHIDDEGFIHISDIGGWDAQVLVGQRIRFLGAAGDVFGVVGRKAIHLLKPDERDKAAKLTDLWVDIGAASKAEAMQRLAVGDPGVIDAKAMEFPNQRLVSRSIDDRIGAFIVLEALRRYGAKPGAARVTAVATTQEEIAWFGGGAAVSAAASGAAMAIVVDVTHATDTPGIEKKEIGDNPIGGGPVLSRGSIVSPVVLRLLRATADELQIPYTMHAAGRDTGTDADSIHVAREGIATGLVSVANRYMHSPSEMVSLEDLDRAASLIAETCRRVTATTDFTAR